jgi:ABC-type transport system substrate-binding protein
MEAAPYPRAPITTLIQQQLAAIGIRVEVQFHPWKDFEGKDCTAIRNGQHFDLGLAGWLGNGERYPLVWIQQSAISESVPGPENNCGPGKYNWSGWRNPQADALFVRLKDGRLALEQPAEYRRLWAEHQRLWAADLPSLPLFTWQRPVATSSRLQDVQPSPYAFGSVEDTWNIYEWMLK